MTQQSFTNLLKSLDLRWHQVWHQFVSMSTVDISFKHCMLLFDFSNCQREHDEMVTFAGILETSSWLQNLPTLCKGSRVFDHEEPFWAHLDPFGPFQTRIDILLRSTSANPYFVHLGQKNHFCLKWSKRVQMGPKWVPNDQKHLGWPFWSLSDPFGPLWSVDKPAMFGPFWSKMDHF